MGPLETDLEQKYQGQGFHVLGFYSNDFGNQAGDPEACTGTYNVTFPQFQIDHVVGASARPVFKWLVAQPGFEGSAPTWNFHKWLVARDGTLVATWSTTVNPGVDNPGDPNDIPSRIEAELAK